MYLEILILAQLTGKPMHGYEIKKESERILGSIYSMNNNSLYPTLKRLEKSGAIVKRIELQQGKPDKYIYNITPLGLKMLNSMILDFPENSSFVNMEFYTRVTFFNLISSDERKAIIERRKKTLTEIKSHIESLSGNNPRIPDEGRVYVLGVLDLLKRHAQAELDWIKEFEPTLDKNKV